MRALVTFLNLVVLPLLLSVGLSGQQKPSPGPVPSTEHAITTASSSSSGDQVISFDQALRACAGECDLTRFSGAMEIASPSHNLTIAEGATIHLAHGTIITSDVIHVSANATIMGPRNKVTIKAAEGFLPGAVIQLEGAQASLQNVVVDGSRELNANAGYAAISVMAANRVEMENVSALFGPGTGIFIHSSKEGGGNESCCAKLRNVIAFANTGAGLYVENTGDVFCSMCEFEENGIGVFLSNASGNRIEHSDIGGSTTFGLVIVGDPEPAWGNLIVGNQFGNNRNHDIAIWGKSGYNVITGNAFIGASGRFIRGAQTYGILDQGAWGFNTINGNNLSRGDYPYLCIASLGSDMVAGNTCRTSDIAAPTGPFRVGKSKPRN